MSPKNVFGVRSVGKFARRIDEPRFLSPFPPLVAPASGNAATIRI